ncbi:hypothetical protein ACFX13_022074 [Malus domestica]
MRTLLITCVAFALILAFLQADAKRLTPNERHLLASLKNDQNQVRSTAVVADGNAKNQPQSQTANNNEAKLDEDDGDANESYGQYGNAPTGNDSHLVDLGMDAYKIFSQQLRNELGWGDVDVLQLAVVLSGVLEKEGERKAISEIDERTGVIGSKRSTMGGFPIRVFFDPVVT